MFTRCQASASASSTRSTNTGGNGQEFRRNNRREGSTYERSEQRVRAEPGRRRQCGLANIIQGVERSRNRGYRRGGGGGRGNGNDRISKYGGSSHRNGGYNRSNDNFHRNNKPWIRNLHSGWRNVKVTNLFYGLNEEDLKGLFSQVGPVRFVKIEYDKAGRSEGVAWVGFLRSTDAQEAVERFNNKMAAGQEIELRLCSTVGLRREHPTEDLAPRFNPKPRPAPKPKPTAEDLDAELIAYMGGDNADQGSQSSAADKEAQNDNEKEKENDEIVIEGDVEMK